MLTTPSAGSASRWLFAFRRLRLIASSGAPETRNFSRPQFAELARLNVKRERTITHALDFFHVMANLFKHAAYLAILALDQSHFIPGIFSVFHQADLRGRSVDRFHTSRPGLGANLDSAPQLFDPFFLSSSRNLYQVSLGYVRGSVRKFGSEFSVIG
jgi:hypothetical protein